MTKWSAGSAGGTSTGGTGSGDEVDAIVDGQPVSNPMFSTSLAGVLEEIGAAPATVLDDLARKADLVNGKVPASQLPAVSGGAGATSSFMVITGTTEALPDGYDGRVLFSTGSYLIGSGTFASPPFVIAIPVSAAAATTTVRAFADTVDIGGFTMHLRRSNATLTSASWIAMGASA